MKKDVQLAINEWVENAFETCMDEYEESVCSFRSKWKPLRTCKADVYETKNFYILRSYNTIVACINKNNGQAYDFLRMVFGYTSTSAQHIAKFVSDYGDRRIANYTYRDV